MDYFDIWMDLGSDDYTGVNWVCALGDNYLESLDRYLSFKIELINNVGYDGYTPKSCLKTSGWIYEGNGMFAQDKIYPELEPNISTGTFIYDAFFNEITFFKIDSLDMLPKDTDEREKLIKRCRESCTYLITGDDKYYHDCINDKYYIVTVGYGWGQCDDAETIEYYNLKA